MEGLGQVRITSQKPQCPSSCSAPEPPEEQECTLGVFLMSPSIRDACKHNRGAKWFFTAIISLAAAVAPLGNTILMPALPTIGISLNTHPSVVNMSIAFYSLAMAVTPLWWSTASELYGRRPTYLISFLLVLVFYTLAAISSSIQLFLVMRVLAGGTSASVQAVGAATVADLWEVERRGTAMGVFFLAPVVCPLIAPIVGGALTETLGWRSTQWAMVVYGGFVWLLILVFLPETLQQRPAPTAASITAEMSQILFEPLRTITYLHFPPLAMTISYGSLTFASYYWLDVAVQKVFSRQPYSFSSMALGSMYIPAALGSIIGSVAGGRWTDYIMQREAKKVGRYNATGQLIYRPTDRMHENAWLASTLYPAGLLLFGWTVYKHVLWAIPCIATFLFGLGSALVFNIASTMLTEFLPTRASHGIALNNLVRNALACVAAALTDPAINAIGTGWLFTGLAVVCWASAIFIWLLKKNADKWAKDMSNKLAQDEGQGKSEVSYVNNHGDLDS